MSNYLDSNATSFALEARETLTSLQQTPICSLISEILMLLLISGLCHFSGVPACRDDGAAGLIIVEDAKLARCSSRQPLNGSRPFDCGNSLLVVSVQWHAPYVSFRVRRSDKLDCPVLQPSPFLPRVGVEMRVRKPAHCPVVGR